MLERSNSNKYQHSGRKDQYSEGKSDGNEQVKI